MNQYAMQNRHNPMPSSEFTTNPVMANTISQNDTFRAIANQVQHWRDKQAMMWRYIYAISDDITGQQTKPFVLTIEQGTDFICEYITASAFSYDAQSATSFPVPNNQGLTAWAGRGISVSITDSNAGRELTSSEIPLELIATPGYGLNFQGAYPFPYFFYRNNKIRFDVRNRDNSNREHSFAIALHGWKVATPQ